MFGSLSMELRGQSLMFASRRNRKAHAQTHAHSLGTWQNRGLCDGALINYSFVHLIQSSKFYELRGIENGVSLNPKQVGISLRTPGFPLHVTICDQQKQRLMIYGKRRACMHVTCLRLTIRMGNCIEVSVSLRKTWSSRMVFLAVEWSFSSWW